MALNLNKAKVEWMRILKETLRIVLVYFIFSVLWILFSDALLEYFIDNVKMLTLIQTYKGLFFVTVTSLLLFVLIRRHMQQLYHTQEKLQENQQRLEYVIQGANLGYWDWDYVSNKQWVNDTWLQFLGLERADIKEEVTDWSDAIHPDDKNIAQKAIQFTIKYGHPYVIEFRMRHKKGHWVWIEGSGAVVKWDEESKKPLRLAGTHRDISERKKAQEEITFLALNDPLTKLPNRYFLKQHLVKVLEEREKNAFLFLDLDFFKNINDLYGHSVGDIVIQEAAERFKACLSKHEFISRVGGDEFVIITTKSQSVILSERLIQSLCVPFHINNEQFTLGVSIGIAIASQDGENFEELFKNADTAMYVAKSSGKNRYAFYTSSMTDEILSTTLLDKEMKQGIEEEQFILHYQPLIDLSSDAIMGAEVLVRWQHPEKGLIFPNEFIPRAEETHLIIPLGELILKKAFQQLFEWDKQGIFKGMIAINISSVQIEQDDFIAKIEALCKELCVDTSKIELEVTESFLMKNPKKSAQTLQKLENLGFSIAVDDFGTGYSSLSYLKTFPIHKLKIDRSFIQDLPEDKDDRAIVRAIISLAKNLELDVLAEGVETQAQKEFLIENWCDSAQGYLFAKPLTREDFERLIHKN